MNPYSFIHEALVRRKMWTPKGMRPMVTVTGSHQKTCVFGTIITMVLDTIGIVVVLFCPFHCMGAPK